MSLLDSSPRRELALTALRAIAALIFISSGTTKLWNVPHFDMPGLPVPLFSLLGIAAGLEVVGGLAILLGLFTRPVAFILSGQMAVAYFYAHASASFFPTVNGGVPAVLYCFLYLYLAFAGGGAFSLDRALRRSSARRQGVKFPVVVDRVIRSPLHVARGRVSV